MKKDAHISSSSNISKPNNTTYKNESEIRTFNKKDSNNSTNIPYYASTIKTLRNIQDSEGYSTKLYLNLSKISKQEANYKLNQRLAGKDNNHISTKNE